MPNSELIPHLFRTEFTKIVAVLCKTYGFANIQLAEDLVSETFLKATETWGLKGLPENPTAWLYTVAKNKTKDHFKHTAVFNTKVRPDLKSNAVHTSSDNLEIDWSETNIEDSQLQMLFAVCNPLLSNEAQIGLALRILCGFGVDEIASALLTTKATINKRLYRAKEKFREAKIELVMPADEEINERLSSVLSVIYLLYNEGYYSASSDKAMRKDLCFEAMRLLLVLINNLQTNDPIANALLALFCFHSSRFDARIDASGATILYEDQDQSKWEPELIQRGEYYLNEAAQGPILSKYHIEASIAFWHTRIEIDEKEKWHQILQLYNRLLQIEYSPIIALNRTYALSKSEGNAVALKEALKINLADNHLYHSLLAELYVKIDPIKQLEQLQKALGLAKNEHDKIVTLQKIEKLKSKTETNE
ncbi:MAG: RNA polymerase subunit sigma [Crocinitomix sp.]|nr:RNA polymerase subunit sigma [Crocinitomix sp.]